jgi:hypothetical protein
MTIVSFPSYGNTVEPIPQVPSRHFPDETVSGLQIAAFRLFQQGWTAAAVGEAPSVSQKAPRHDVERQFGGYQDALHT